MLYGKYLFGCCIGCKYATSSLATSHTNPNQHHKGEEFTNIFLVVWCLGLCIGLGCMVLVVLGLGQSVCAAIARGVE